MYHLCLIYSQTGFNKVTKYGFLYMEVMKIYDITTVAMFRFTSSSGELEKVVKDFKNTMWLFTITCNALKEKKRNQRDSQSTKDVRLLARNDDYIQKIRSKIDVLAKQLSSLTMKSGGTSKTFKASSADQTHGEIFALYNREKAFTYFQRPGYGAGRCPDNVNRERNDQILKN